MLMAQELTVLTLTYCICNGKINSRWQTLIHEYFETSHVNIVMHSHVYKTVQFPVGCNPGQSEHRL